MMSTIEYDEKSGSIRDKITNERYILVSKTRTLGMIEKLVEIFKDGAYTVLYEMSKAEAKHILKNTPTNLQSDPLPYLQTYLQRFEDSGIGKFTICEFNPKNRNIRLKIENNFYCDYCNESTAGNAITQGMLAGMYEIIFKKEPII